ncbi:hypothetical protein YC2023_059643 [Brassica napus]
MTTTKPQYHRPNITPEGTTPREYFKLGFRVPDFMPSPDWYRRFRRNRAGLLYSVTKSCRFAKDENGGTLFGFVETLASGASCVLENSPFHGLIRKLLKEGYRSFQLFDPLVLCSM